MFHKIRLTAWERIRDTLLDHPVGGGRGTGAVGEDDHRLKFCRPQRRRWRRHRRALIRAAALGGHKERRFTGRRHPRLGFREWKWSGGRLSAGNCPPLPARQVGTLASRTVAEGPMAHITSRALRGPRKFICGVRKSSRNFYRHSCFPRHVEEYYFSVMLL
jgi:hypothetical protein